MLFASVALGALMWVIVLALPWRPHATRERLEAADGAQGLLGEVSVSILIPARNEAAVLPRTLAALHSQDGIQEILLVDDHSIDGTADVARSSGDTRLRVLHAPPLPKGWSGKLWALEQARLEARGDWLLLLDADIELQPGMVHALLTKARHAEVELVSVMAELRMQGFWERLLMPPFVFFFKLLYPFALANGPDRRFAAAAGGVLLLARTRMEALGGLACIRDALIDDCSLAAAVKNHGSRIWVGLTHGAKSLREYPNLASVWNMVARTAYTQLQFSPLLLGVCAVLMYWAFIAPILGLVAGDAKTRFLALTALVAMSLAYRPTLQFYGLALWRVLSLPAAGVLFLLMTLGSALAHHAGRTASWRGRNYDSK